MEIGQFRPYTHSGKFGVHAFVVVPLLALLLGWPLGLAYGYLIKWIPFVYLNLLITGGYGLLLGVATGAALKACRVRSRLVATGLAVLVGVAANYFQWNGHLHALFDDMPWLCTPAVLRGAMEFLLEHGSWGFRSGGNVTGWLLAAIWAVEALAILVFIVFLGTDPVRTLPYCEKVGAWLDEQDQYDTLAAFTAPEQLAQLRCGDVTPVLSAAAKGEDSDAFGRLTLKHSPRSQEFFTLRVENMVRTVNKKGEAQLRATPLTGDLVLPWELREAFMAFADMKPVRANAMPDDA